MAKEIEIMVGLTLNSFVLKLYKNSKVISFQNPITTYSLLGIQTLNLRKLKRSQSEDQ